MLTNEIFKNITDAAKTINITVSALAKQLRINNSKCIFEYCDNPLPKKLTKVIKNTITNEIFFSIEDVAAKENLKRSAAEARTVRKSKNWNYVFDKINYIEYLKDNKNGK